MARQARDKDDRDEPKNERISLLVRNGRLAIDAMRPASRERFASLLSDPGTARELGLTQSPLAESGAPPAAPGLPPAIVRPLVSVLSLLETTIITRITRGAAPELVAKIAPYSPEETDAIAGPLAAVLDKYLPSNLLTKWGEETALITVLATITYAKIAAIRGEMDRQVRASMVAPPAPPIVPTFPPVVPLATPPIDPVS